MCGGGDNASPNLVRGKAYKIGKIGFFGHKKLVFETFLNVEIVANIFISKKCRNVMFWGHKLVLSTRYTRVNIYHTHFPHLYEVSTTKNQAFSSKYYFEKKPFLLFAFEANQICSLYER